MFTYPLGFSWTHRLLQGALQNVKASGSQTPCRVERGPLETMSILMSRATWAFRGPLCPSPGAGPGSRVRLEVQSLTPLYPVFSSKPADQEKP